MTASLLKMYEFAAADPQVRFSPHCWKTRMAVAHKGLEAYRIAWRFTDKDEISFSGQGFVPVVVHGDQIVSDSWEIAHYLESRFPNKPSLFGNHESIAVSRFVNAWADRRLLPKIGRIILIDIYEHIDERDKDYFRSSREKRFGQTLEKASENPFSLLKELSKELAPLRSTLRSQDFIAGSTPKYADYCVFGMFMWARCISTTELLAEDNPIFQWRERLLDAFDGMGRNAPTAAAA
ncbi:MAG: glutathione S-transferase family protein [Pseudomonadota bacterium]